MTKDEFVDETLNNLFNNFMPPGTDGVKSKLSERFGTEIDEAMNVEKASWELYEYKTEDRSQIRQKIMAAVAETALNEARRTGHSSTELGLIAPESEDYEIERYFEGRTENQALQKAINYAEEQGYSVQEPTGEGESVFDWRFDGRRLTQIRE